MIHIEEPCSKDWNEMIPNQNGKFCNSCSKTVFDVTQKTETEISEIYLENNNSMCVRIKNEQLTDFQFIHPTKRFLAALLLVFGSSLFTFTAVAQDFKPVEKVLKSTSIITGIVKDEEGEPIPFTNVSVQLADSVISGGVTDFDGRYRFSIPKEHIGKKAKLVYSIVGYVTIEIENYIIKTGTSNIAEVTFKENYLIFMGDIIIGGSTPLKPAENPSKTTFKQEEIQRSSSGK